MSCPSTSTTVTPLCLLVRKLIGSSGPFTRLKSAPPVGPRRGNKRATHHPRRAFESEAMHGRAGAQTWRAPPVAPRLSASPREMPLLGHERRQAGGVHHVVHAGAAGEVVAGAREALQ